MAQTNTHTQFTSFARGLLTEASPLETPPNAILSGENFEVGVDGSATRRLGIDSVVGGPTAAQAGSGMMNGDAYIQTFRWEGAGDDGIDIIVVRVGNTITFYRDDGTTVFFGALDSKIIGEFDNNSDDRWDFESRNGVLYITGPSGRPVSVVRKLGVFTVYVHTLLVRDFTGQQTPIAVDVRPTDLDDLGYKYNMYNRGWTDEQRTEYYQDSASSSGLWATPIDKDLTAPPGAPAPGDTYIVASPATGAWAGRANQLATYLGGPSSSWFFVAPKVGYLMAPADETTTYEWDGTNWIVSTTASFPSQQELYHYGLSIDPATGEEQWSAKQTQMIAERVKDAPIGHLRLDSFNTNIAVRGDADLARVVLAQQVDANTIRLTYTGELEAGSITLAVMGVRIWNGAVSTNYTKLDGVYTVDAWNPGAKTIDIDVGFTADALLTLATSGGIIEYRGFIDTSSLAKTVPDFNPSAVAGFEGRTFYAGNDTDSFGAVIQFSRITRDDPPTAGGIDPRDPGACYQINDPTNKDFFELLPNDGGVIAVREMLNPRHMATFGNYLLIFAENGVWALNGGETAQFRANDYSIQKVSDIGIISPESVVEADGSFWYVAPTGIHVLGRNEQGQFVVQNATQESIHSLFVDIPSAFKSRMVGAYDKVSRKIRYLYQPSTESDAWNFHKELAFDMRTGSWSPTTFTDSAVANASFITGIVPTTVDTDTNKGVVYLNSFGTGTDGNIGWAEKRRTDYADWTDRTGTAVDVPASMVVGYHMGGQEGSEENTRRKGITYLVTHMAQETGAGCKVQGQWDWANHGDSGRWSSKQNVYKDRPNFDTSVSRVKIRGHGRTISLKFEAEAGKPCRIYGWSIDMTIKGRL